MDKTIVCRLWAIQVKFATGWIGGLSKKTDYTHNPYYDHSMHSNMTTLCKSNTFSLSSKLTEVGYDGLVSHHTGS